MVDLASSRAARAPVTAGLYESHFVSASDPAGGRALWIRYTALKRRGEAAWPTVWVTWFDPARDTAPRALRVTADAPIAADPSPLWAASPLGAIGPGMARGEIEGASWDLRFEGLGPELPYLPARWLYDRPLPRSNGVALAPAALVSGTLTLDGTTTRLDGWDGTIGHNWGSDHAEEWSWIHAGGLGDERRGWLELTLARVRIGPVLTPWLAAGAAAIDGRAAVPARRARVRRELRGERTEVSLALAGGGELALEITAPERATVTWDYAAPAGPGRTVRNCSVADAVVTLGAARIEITGRLAVEHGAPA